jgi:cytochrome P450
VTHAAEEFFRIATPLTHIGRVCPEPSDVVGEAVPADGRVSLCWISANRDAEVFDEPHEVRLDRKPNPHVAFGFGAHLCLGAPHARLLVKTLLRELAERVERIEVIEAEPLVEKQERYERANGYYSLRLKLSRR